MLFKKVHLQGIKSGKITFAFRKWQKSSVKCGSLLHTSVGLVEIGKIETISENDITEQDAIQAGFTDKQQLLKSFTPNSKGTIFKISVSYHSADPRIKLREKMQLSEQGFTVLKKKLERLDNYSKQGYWTNKVLLTIKDNPNLHAIGIAKLTGFEKEWLKLNIRKLKNLGLTISHNVGYELSPLGNEYLRKQYFGK
ncbi:ASCH domain-containing protein [Sphingobacterium sp. ML3W]|uniref:ASCH domain-containing protein n=1 Tax=Sphingobacterium sp. ML3W TaxID=1538644 RepID=UPI00068EA52C|nr:ASCH domain-containing protein [Sphingobacterium sp. ML3W]